MEKKQEDSKTWLFEKEAVPKALQTMIVPAIMSQIIVLVYNMADTFYIGQTNNPYMVAGVSLLMPVFNMGLCIAGLAGIGGGTLISRLLGLHEPRQVKKVSSFSFWLATAATLICSFLMAVCMEPILTFLGAGAQTMNFAAQYAWCVLVFGGLPVVLSNTLSHLLRSIGYSGQASMGIMLGGLINIVLDPLFMFVLLEPGNEVLGVGIATMISNCLACLYFAWILVTKRESLPLSFSLKAGLPNSENIRSVFRVGIPACAATLLFDLDYMVIDRLMSGYSDMALAAIGIVLKIERLPLNIGVGICQGMVPLIAYNYAAANYDRMHSFIRLSLTIGLICGVLSIVLYEAAAPALVSFFIEDPETVAHAEVFIRIRILATPLMFLSFFTVHLFQAFGKGMVALFLGVMRWAVFNIPMLYLLEHFVGIMGLVYSQICGDILTVLLSWLTWRWFSKQAFQNESAALPAAETL